MLTTLAVSNYRTLRDLVMPLRRLNLITDRRRGGRAQVSDAALGLQSAAFPFLREQPC